MIKDLIKEKREVLVIKVSETEKKTLQALADKYAGGNLSAWLRWAGQNCKPSQKTLAQSA